MACFMVDCDFGVTIARKGPGLAVAGFLRFSSWYGSILGAGIGWRGCWAVFLGI